MGRTDISQLIVERRSPIRSGGGVEMQLGTKPLARLTPNRIEITSMEKQEDQTPQEASQAWGTSTRKISSNIWLCRPVGLKFRVSTISRA